MLLLSIFCGVKGEIYRNVSTIYISLQISAKIRTLLQSILLKYSMTNELVPHRVYSPHSRQKRKG